jgi:hypothetical protein
MRMERSHEKGVDMELITSDEVAANEETTLTVKVGIEHTPVINANVLFERLFS